MSHTHTILIPEQLRWMAAFEFYRVEGHSLAECFQCLSTIAPILTMELFDENGAPHNFLAVFVNSRKVEHEEFSEALTPDSRIRLNIAASGG